jgi:hypothetical protein
MKINFGAFSRFVFLGWQVKACVASDLPLVLELLDHFFISFSPPAVTLPVSAPCRVNPD